MNSRKNLITGVVVIVTLVLFFFGFNFLKGRNILDSANVYYALYSQIDGLKKASKVTIRGMKVGEVQDISFTNERAEALLVAFSVSSDYHLPKGTLAQIVTSSIMGSRSLELRLPSSNTEGFLKQGDTLNSGISKGLKEELNAQILPFKNKVHELMHSMDSILIAARTVFGKESQKDLIASIRSMKNTFSHLESSTGKLNNVITGEEKSMGSILRNFASISENLEKNNEKINMILGNVSSFTDTLTRANFAGTLIEAQQAIEKFTTMVNKIESGEGTVGALLNDKQLYDNLERATANMERLLTDFRMNPKKYVSFSLLKTGRNVYYNSEKPQNTHTMYRIQLLHTSTPIDLQNPIFKGHTNVEQIQNKKGEYLYTIGHSEHYKKLQKQLKKLRKDFPEAYIVEDKQ